MVAVQGWCSCLIQQLALMNVLRLLSISSLHHVALEQGWRFAGDLWHGAVLRGLLSMLRLFGRVEGDPRGVSSKLSVSRPRYSKGEGPCHSSGTPAGRECAAATELRCLL